jgi:polyhydroxyalkanoate synthesis regulator phasin
MANVQELFKEAWSHALAGATAAEQEAERVFNRVADVAGFSPEDVRRHAREFGERLKLQRKELEKSIDEGVRKAATRLQVPTKRDLDALEQRLTALATKVDELAKEKGNTT